MTKMPKLYVEDPRHQMPSVYLPETVYAQAIGSFIIVCTDALVMNRTQRTIALVQRIARPMRGFWCMGGRRQAGERAEASVRRCFQRETQLALPEKRFHFLGAYEYHWKDRAQEPQDTGSHNLSYQFTVELDADERAFVAGHLDPREYDPAFGLQDFTRPELVAAGAHAVILDWYDTLFPVPHGSGQ